MPRRTPRTHARLPFRFHALAVALAAAGASAAMPAQAQAPLASSVRDYDLPADALATTLNRIAVDAGMTLSVDTALVQNKRANAVRGRFTAEAALREALRGSGLELARTPAGSFTLRAVSQGAVTLQTMKISADADRVGEPAEHGFKADYQRSATKMRMSIRETPQAISTVTADSIKARQARDITSALELTAGLVPSSESTIGGPFAGRGLSSNEEFTLRGQSLNGARDIRVDGFSLATPELDLALFERIDVVKGPSSMLYGQGSLGGFINFVRKKPQAEQRTQISGTVASWDTYRADLDTTGALDSEGRVSGRLIAAYDDAGSFIDSVWTKRAVLAPNFDVQVSDDTRLLVDLIWQDDDFSPSHGIPLLVKGDTLEIPDIPRSRLTGKAASKDSYATTRLINLQLDHELSDRWLASLALQKGWQKFGRYFDNYAHGGIDSTGSDPNPLTTGDTYLYADTQTTDQEFWSGEIRLDGRFDLFGREHQLLVGTDRNRRQYDDTFGYHRVGAGNIYSGEFITDGTRAEDLDAGPSNGYIANNGVYVQALFGITERTKILAGARYDETDQTGGNDAMKHHEVTMRYGLTYDVSKNITAYAMYGESFNPVDSLTIDKKLLDPEEGEAYELGLKTEWNDGKIAVNVALYQQDLDNRPITDPRRVPDLETEDPDDYLHGSISSGLQRTRGAEIEVFGSPLPGLEMSAGLGWADSEYIRRIDPEYGLVPYGTIKRNGGLHVSYELQEGALRGLGAGITYVYVGRRSFAYAGLSDPGSCCVSGATSDQLWFEGFDRTDLSFFYKGLRNWEFSLQVRNVTDDVYVERMRDIESNNYFGSPTAYLLRVDYTL